MMHDFHGVEVSIVSDTGHWEQAKRHKRRSSRRWQKKWRKKFGDKWVIDSIIPDGEVMRLKLSPNTLFMNVRTWDSLKREIENRSR